MRATTLLAIATLAGACVSKGKYNELETMYNTAVEERDTAAAERDAAQDKVQQIKERERTRAQRFMDVYEELLAVQEQGLAKIKIEDGRAVLQLESDVLFASGSAQLTEAGEETVAEIAKLLAQGSGGRYQVEGHTDNEPIDSREFPSNWHLGADRAINVVQVMIDAGLPADRISAASYGEHAPQVSNDKPEGRAQNRRIEIVAVPELSKLLPYKRMLKEMKKKEQEAQEAQEEQEAQEAQEAQEG